MVATYYRQRRRRSRDENPRQPRLRHRVPSATTLPRCHGLPGRRWNSRDPETCDRQGHPRSPEHVLLAGAREVSAVVAPASQWSGCCAGSAAIDLVEELLRPLHHCCVAATERVAPHRFEVVNTNPL